MTQLALIGDVMLGRLVDEYLDSRADPCYVWGTTRDVIQSCELAICNLECVIADSGSPWHEESKAFHFRSHAKNVRALECAGINAVTLANNHSLDFGTEALLEMFSILDRSKIAHPGAGQSLDEATQPVTLKFAGTNFSLLSFTDGMPEWAAGHNGAGIYFVPPDSSSPLWQDLFDKVTEAKTKSDFLIISPHWGSNWGYEVEPLYSMWAHKIIDAGADMIFGHSGHVPRGIEIYNGKPIIYSAGDFIDDYAISDAEPNDEGFIYLLVLDGGIPISLRLHPIVIKNFQAQLAGSRAERVARHLLKLSQVLGTTGYFDPQTLVVTIPIRRDQP